MWAVIATVFVYRTGHEQSVTAGLTRSAATRVSFALCFIYLLIASFHPWALAFLIGLGTLVLMTAGRQGEVVVAAITTAVVMVVAAICPHHAWQQPILRLADTVIGVVIGLSAAWAAKAANRDQPMSPALPVTPGPRTGPR
jgi:hypothetical protein